MRVNRTRSYRPRSSLVSFLRSGGVQRRIGSVEQRAEIVETLRPEPLIEAEPLACRGKRHRLDAADMRAPTDPPPHEARFLEDSHMLRGGGKSHPEGSGKLADVAIARSKTAQHLP